MDEVELPPGVHPISHQDIARLGVGQDGQLYWDGRRVVTRLDLSFWQWVVAVVTGAAIVVGGLGSLVSGIDAGHAFGCKLHWWTVGCPVTSAAQGNGAGGR